MCVLSFRHAGLASESGHQDSSKDHQLLSPLSAHFILSWMKPPCQSVKSYLRRLHWLVSLSIASRKSIYTFSVSENVLLCRFEMHDACYQREDILAFWECLYFFKTLLIFFIVLNYFEHSLSLTCSVSDVLGMVLSTSFPLWMGHCVTLFSVPRIFFYVHWCFGFMQVWECRVSRSWGYK